MHCAIKLGLIFICLFFALDLMVLKEESQELNVMEEKDQYKNQCGFITGEKSFTCSQTEKTSSSKKSSKDRKE